jgi:hypothetical protein
VELDCYVCLTGPEPVNEPARTMVNGTALCQEHAGSSVEIVQGQPQLMIFS